MMNWTIYLAPCYEENRNLVLVDQAGCVSLPVFETSDCSVAMRSVMVVGTHTCSSLMLSGAIPFTTLYMNIHSLNCMQSGHLSQWRQSLRSGLMCSKREASKVTWLQHCTQTVHSRDGQLTDWCRCHYSNLTVKWQMHWPDSLPYQ